MSTREFVGNGMIELREKTQNEADIKRYVKKRLPIGSTFKATKNFWSQDDRESSEPVERMIIEYYDHHLTTVTMDWLKWTESFTYFDLYAYLKGGKDTPV